MAKVAFSARIFVLLAGFAPRFAPHTGKPVHVERRSRNEPRDLTSPRVDALHGMVTQCQLRVVSVPTIQVLRRVLAAGTRRSAKTYERTSTAREKDVQRLIERGSRVWKEGRFPECRYTQSHQSRILRPCKRDVLGNRLPGLPRGITAGHWLLPDRLGEFEALFVDILLSVCSLDDLELHHWNWVKKMQAKEVGRTTGCFTQLSDWE